MSHIDIITRLLRTHRTATRAKGTPDLEDKAKRPGSGTRDKWVSSIAIKSRMRIVQVPQVEEACPKSRVYTVVPTITGSNFQGKVKVESPPFRTSPCRYHPSLSLFSRVQSAKSTSSTALLQLLLSWYKPLLIRLNSTTAPDAVTSLLVAQALG
jgi:hypothetical protein